LLSLMLTGALGSVSVYAQLADPVADEEQPALKTITVTAQRRAEEIVASLNVDVMGAVRLVEAILPMMREQQPEIYEMVRQSVPSGRLGTPKEIADAAVWLVSPRAGWVNGVALVVDGGQSKAIR